MQIQLKTEPQGTYGLFEDVELMVHLRKHLRLLATSLGTLPQAPSQNKVLGPPFMLTPFQVRYLQELGLVSQATTSESSFGYEVFKLLTSKFYYLKEGYKFGVDFLVYEGDPLVCHAKWLLLVQRTLTVQKLVELGRIANYSKKQLVVAYEHNSQVKLKLIRWTQLHQKRQKPVPRVH